MNKITKYLVIVFVILISVKVLGWPAPISLAEKVENSSLIIQGKVLAINVGNKLFKIKDSSEAYTSVIINVEVKKCYNEVMKAGKITITYNCPVIKSGDKVLHMNYDIYTPPAIGKSYIIFLEKESDRGEPLYSPIHAFSLISEKDGSVKELVNIPEEAGGTVIEHRILQLKGFEDMLKKLLTKKNNASN